MTDNEIIKALEICIKSITYYECEKCPYYDDENEPLICTGNLLTDALDLINRLQARVEYYKNNRDKYQDDVMYLSKLCDELQAENERLEEKQEKCFYCTEQANKKIGEIKAEAYKEVFEKVENMLWQMKTEYLQQGNTEYASALVITHTKLQNLSKELVGDSNVK
jgi:FtsZ-binding cell division protein ZapB